MSALRIEKLLSKSIRPYDYQAELSCTRVLRITPLQLLKQKAAILVCVKITTNKEHCCIADASPPSSPIINDAKQAKKKLRVCTFQLHCRWHRNTSFLDERVLLARSTHTHQTLCRNPLQDIHHSKNKSIHRS
jgi:hypothetical protein